MKTRPALLLIILALPLIACAADVEIIGFTNGRLTWSNSNVEGTATIEWSPDLLDQWQSDWSSLTDVPITSSVMTVSIPMFFRVVQRTYAPLTNGFVTLPYDTADRATYLADTNAHPNGYGTYQKDGPQYAFRMAVYEVTCAEFCEFLNDTEANPATPRGANMFFITNDWDKGRVYMDETEQFGEKLYVRVSEQIDYHESDPVGTRYQVSSNTPLGGGTYSNHPVRGVTWYGALKYCNWKTIVCGLGESQRCYREGTSEPEWMPITANSWDLGQFTPSERLAWLQYAGFRLPMDGGTTTASAYNEFYKAAAWTGGSNTVYGFGRSLLGARDANYLFSNDPYEDPNVDATTPVGYYDGSDHGGVFVTRPERRGVTH